jgi:hypothetical protein
MQRVDYKDEFRSLYRPSGEEPTLVEVPPFEYLMVDGAGDPNTSESFQDAVETLYPLAYEIRSLVKSRQELAMVVMPLEGLWWADDESAFTEGRKDDWEFTLLVMQPDPVTESLVAEARERLADARDLPALSEVRFDTYEEGLAAQILHVGSFETEGPTVERLHAFVREEGYGLRGTHHEVYLSDMRRTDPEKLRTVIRQPVG